jgi:hypothetical protein
MVEGVPDHWRDARERAPRGDRLGASAARTRPAVFERQRLSGRTRLDAAGRRGEAWPPATGAARALTVTAAGTGVSEAGSAGGPRHAPGSPSRARAWLSSALLLGLCATLPASAPATTIVSIPFRDLVARAERILVTEVVDVASREDASRPGLIVTRVTFRVASVLKGPSAALVALDLVGGALGEASLEVMGLPRFRIGDRDVLFVKPAGRHVSPFVGFAHGRVRITQDPRSGLPRVARFDGRPIASARDFSDPHASHATQAGGAMTLDQFLAEVAREVRAQEAAR